MFPDNALIHNEDATKVNALLMRLERDSGRVDASQPCSNTCTTTSVSWTFMEGRRRRRETVAPKRDP